MNMSYSIGMLRYCIDYKLRVTFTACIQQGRIIPGAYKFNALVTTYEVILGEYVCVSVSVYVYLRICMYVCVSMCVCVCVQALLVFIIY